MIYECWCIAFVYSKVIWYCLSKIIPRIRENWYTCDYIIMYYLKQVKNGYPLWMNPYGEGLQLTTPINHISCETKNCI